MVQAAPEAAFALLFLFTEKEIVRGPGEGDAGGVAYGAVCCVLDGAVGLDVANDFVCCVLDGAIAFDVANCSV